MRLQKNRAVRSVLEPNNLSWALIGAGGHAKQVLDAARRGGLSMPRGVLDTTGCTPVGSLVLGLSCLGGWEYLESHPRTERLAVALAFGANEARLDATMRLESLGIDVLSIIDPTSLVAEHATVSQGANILAHAIVGPGSMLGRSCIVNAGAIVPHDCILGDGAHLAPGAVLGGHVEIGSCTLVGLGAVIRDRVRIGSGCIVGAGAVVVADVPDNQTVVGIPAKELKRRGSES